MKKIILQVLSVFLFFSLLLASCGQKNPEELDINSDTATNSVTTTPGTKNTPNSAKDTPGNTSGGASSTTTPGTTDNSINNSTGANNSTNTPANTSTKTPTATTGPTQSANMQTLKYWTVYPTKGAEKTVKAHKFTVTNLPMGAAITAYDSDGRENKEASFTFFDTSFSKFEITDSTGKLLSSKGADAKNNGIPMLSITLASNKYNQMMNTTNKDIKNTWFDGTYNMVSSSGAQFSGSLRVKRRGHSSFDLPKKPLTLKLSKEQAFAGMNSNKDWVLVANYSDKTLLRNSFAYGIARQMGSFYTPNCKPIDLYLSDGKSSTYMGSYLLVEKIEVAKSKINITEMTPADNSKIKAVNTSSSVADILRGSFLVELETFDRFGTGDVGFMNNSGMQFNIKSPDKDEFASNGYESPTKNKNLYDYIKTFFNVVDSKIEEGGRTTYSLTEIEKYIDIDSFVDYYILNELAKNVDGNLRLSTYFYKDKGGKLKICAWDFDIAFGNCNYNTDDRGQDCSYTSGFYIKEHATWYRRLMRIPAFEAKVKSRWNSLRKGILSNSSIASVINKEANALRNSANANFKVWNILGTEVWPNPYEIAYQCTTYDANVTHLTKWIQDRAKWLDSNL